MSVYEMSIAASVSCRKNDAVCGYVLYLKLMTSVSVLEIEQEIQKMVESWIK